MREAMLTRRSLLHLTTTAAALAALPSHTLLGQAFAATSEDHLAAVQKARQSLTNLSARFDQTRTIGLLAAPVQSKGELVMVRPDQLRWELFAPDDMVYWVTKEGVFFRNQKTKKSGKVSAGARDFGNFLSDMLNFLGGDLKKLGERYTIHADKQLSGSVVITATPRADDAKKVLRKLELVTTPQLWGVSKIAIEEPNDDSSVITFGENQRDQKLDPAKMKPPV